MRSSLVVIPTYNEAKSIGQLLDALEGLDADVLVIDDGSPDGTADAVEALNQAELMGRIFILRRTEKAGLGAAYLAGFEWGFVQGYEAMVEMDADGSHRPEDLATLLKVFYSDPSIDLLIPGVPNTPLSAGFPLAAAFAAVNTDVVAGISAALGANPSLAPLCL